MVKGSMDPKTFAIDFIKTWEGKLSLDKDDAGNWSGGKKGVGALIGSNYGVTPAALAKHRNVSVGGISASAMANLTLDEAADIALSLYYYAPKLNLLPWNRVTASLFDAGWGMGPAQAIKLWQRLIGVSDDGKIGPATAAASSAYRSKVTEEGAAAQWGIERILFYISISQPPSSNIKYLKGWTNRTRYFLPGGEWWTKFA